MGKEKEGGGILEDSEEKLSDKKYFFDTSAIIEIIEGNKEFFIYSNAMINITIFNLAEIYWIALDKLGEEKAEEVYGNYKSAVMAVSDEIIKEAMKFRKEYKNKGFSYADAIGYICAKKNNLKFLTSDSQFKDLDNVEFVK